MSYSFSLRFLTGNLLIQNNDNENQTEAQKCEKFMIVQGEDDELWSCDENSGLVMLEFSIGANEFSFEPEFRVIRALSYSWDTRDGIKNLLKNLDQDLNKIGSSQRTYQCYFILGKTPPPGVVSGLTKRIGRTLLLDRGLKELATSLDNSRSGAPLSPSPGRGRPMSNTGSKNKLYWCVVLGPNSKNSSNTKIRDDLSESLGSFSHRLEQDAKTRVVIGESVSTNCAEVQITF